MSRRPHASHGPEIATMRYLLCGLCVLCAACGSSSTAPSTPPPPVTTTTTTIPPVILQTIQTTPCPTSGPTDLGFFQEIGCNFFEQPAQPVRRWTLAPKLYLRTIDEAGAPIDAVTLDTVQNAMIEIAPALTAGRFQLAVERGASTREGQSGWVTVKWPAQPSLIIACGLSDVARDGGTIELSYKTAGCGCNGSAIRPGTARHELGHTFGYWHTDNESDLMSNLGATKPCDHGLSARELQAVAYQYR